MPSSVHMGGAQIPISGRCTRTSSLSLSWRSCCTGIGLTDGGRGRAVPGPHGEQDAGSRCHQSLRILLLRVLANLKIPWPSLGRLPNEYPICNIEGMDTIQNCFNLPQYYPFSDAFVLFSYLKKSEKPLSPRSSRPIIMHYPLVGSELPWITASDTFNCFSVYFGWYVMNIRISAGAAISSVSGNFCPYKVNSL